MKINVISVLPNSDHTILVTFSNGEVREFDVSPYMEGPWYGELKNADYFYRVQPAGRTVEWPDGQDIAPHELYELSRPVGA